MNIETFESEMSFPGVVLPLRAALVRENSKSILISPVKLSSEQIAKIKSQGGITDIVAPNLIHHLYVAKVKEAFPEATLWGVDGFEKKRPDLKWDKRLTSNQWPYSDFLEVLESQGAPTLNEAFLFHRKSRTLLVTDLCFNVQNPRGFLTPIIFRIFGNYKRFNVSKLLLKYIKDKNAFQKSLNELFKWDFDKIIMSHGEIVESGGKEKLKTAFKNRGFSV